MSRQCMNKKRTIVQRYMMALPANTVLRMYCLSYMSSLGRIAWLSNMMIRLRMSHILEVMNVRRTMPLQRVSERRISNG